MGSPSAILNWLAAIFLGVGGTVVENSAYAATPQDLCSRSASNASPLSALDTDLKRATSAAEQILETVQFDPLLGDKALEQLVVDDNPGAQMNPATLAAFCGVAGEAMRIARSGSGKRARTFLLTALNQAEKADASALRAQIAYRLALVSNNIAVRPNARSAKRSSSDTAQPLTVLRNSGDGSSIQTNECQALLDSDLDSESNWAASRLALECAISSARGPRADQTIALARLQIARIQPSEAERRPISRAELTAQAGGVARPGIAKVGTITAA